ncbi:GNAT family N-acetyltransferase [Gryllotalpicola ginsengisoli]|uniref:GNAT family N-acetyltransferase n=1 Tax=Gryllotalpicola ginsengisoli TaxID=444608 RepID=UPI0003B39C57|nr:GNAT family N-acetyltransferase [Gryllotalpicola ginsengisoli]
MPFESVPVTDPRARELLTEYFGYRAATFPSPGGYVVAMPADDAFTPPDGEFLLLTDDHGRAIGCGAVRRLADEVLGAPARSVWEVKHLWVRETARGSGAGRRLLAELEGRAAARGAQTLVLDTNASLTAANGLYASSGYSPIPAYNDNPNATTWYRKDLR